MPRESCRSGPHDLATGAKGQPVGPRTTSNRQAAFNRTTYAERSPRPFGHKSAEHVIECCRPKDFCASRSKRQPGSSPYRSFHMVATGATLVPSDGCQLWTSRDRGRGLRRPQMNKSCLTDDLSEECPRVMARDKDNFRDTLRARPPRRPPTARCWTLQNTQRYRASTRYHLCDTTERC